MGKILTKSGVEPRILIMLAAIANVAAALPHDVVVTAGIDGKHKTGSRHYTSEALDVRSKNFPSRRAKQEFVSTVLLRLGPGYEMFLELEGKAEEHFHLEWDPRPA